MRYFLAFIILCIGASCQHMKYEPDIAFMSPAHANNPNYLVRVNGRSCEDINGEIGTCALKHRGDQDLTFDLVPQAYNYRLEFRCGNSNGIFFREDVDVLKNASHMIIIPHDKLQGQRYANCIGDITPEGRPEGVGNFFEARLRFFSPDYSAMATPYVTRHNGSRVVVLGKHAHNARVETSKKTYSYKDRTVVSPKGNIKFVMVESQNMRRAYLKGE